MMNKKVFIIAFLILYVGSYYGLSRRAFKQQNIYGTTGFYFFKPYPTFFWKFANYGLAGAYFPLIYGDNKMGWGKPVAPEPRNYRIKRKSRGNYGQHLYSDDLK